MTVVYPSEVPADPVHEAELAEQLRVAEVEGLRRERAQIVARREELAEQKPEAEMVVVDAAGQDTGLRVRRIGAGMAREHHEAELASIDEAIAAVDRELAHRNAAVPREVNDRMPKIKGTVRPPKVKK